MTEYVNIRLNAGTGYAGSTAEIDGLGCLTCGATLFASTHPYSTDKFTLAKARELHSKWHGA